MRTIKFRAWDKGEKKMVIHPSLWTMDLNGGLFYGNAKMTKDDNVFDYPITIMQFTGLLDKNGKEIYEGDIVVLICEQSCGYGIRRQNPRIIEWKEQLNSIGFNLGLGRYKKGGKYEIIGNIYENPELLS